MRKYICVLLFSLSFCLTQVFVFAQDDEEISTYYVMDYMKVDAGMDADYLTLESAWKKIHSANIEEGKYRAWELTRIISPRGYNVSHNYVTRTTYDGEDKLAASLEHFSFPKNVQELLTEEEMKMVKNTEKYRHWVKSEVWERVDKVISENMDVANIQVFNYFAIPEGQDINAHVDAEREIWKPVHASRVAADEMDGWVLLRMVMPYGSNREYSEATVDLYSTLEDHLSKSTGDHFEQVHAGDDFDKMWERTKASSDLIWSEVRQYLDSVKKEE